MKAFVMSICALLALSSAAIAQNISAEDLDLACAVTAGAIFGSNPKGGAERDASKMVWTFYLGRLSGRDDKTIWNTMIKGRIAEMGEIAKSEELYGKCVDFYTDYLCKRYFQDRATHRFSPQRGAVVRAGRSIAWPFRGLNRN